ncbi:MAG: FAD-binding protein, partial [Bacteroidia bacterium]
MIKEIEITLSPEQVKDVEAIKVHLADKLRIKVAQIQGHQILKRSIDARSRKVIYRLQVRAFIDEPLLEEAIVFNYPQVKSEETVIIVGAGPAGLFAALQ